MKKWIVSILVLAVVGAAAAFYVFKILPGGQKVSSLESLVPDNALFYVSSYNLDKKIKEFRSSDFVSKLTGSAIYKTRIEPQLAKLFQSAPFLLGFLEEDVSVALLSLGNLDSPQGGFADLGDFLILVRLNPKKRAQIQRQVIETYLSVAGKGKTSSKNYKGIKISKYGSLEPPFVINYAFIADVLVLSNNGNVIQKGIDLYQKADKNNLSGNSNFVEIRNRVKKDSWVWGYQNNEAYNRQLLAYYASGALRSKSGRWAAYAVDPRQLAPIMDLMNIFKASGFSFTRDIGKDGFLLKSCYFLAESKSKAVSEITKFITDRKVMGGEVLRLVPRDILVYLGARKDIAALWNFIKYSFSRMSQADLLPPAEDRSQEAVKGIKENVAKAESFLGVNIEKDILPALGDSFGLVLADLQNTQINILASQGRSPGTARGGFSIPIPQAYAYLELKDVSKLQGLLEGATQKLVEKANQEMKARDRRWRDVAAGQEAASANQTEELVPPQEGDPLSLRKENYQDAEIVYLDPLNFPLESFKPNYCFLDKYLIASYSLALTKEVIDVYKNKGDSFAKNQNFLSVKNKIPAEYSDLVFFDIKRSIDQFRRAKFFDSMLYQMLSYSNPNGVKKEELEELLDVLSDLVCVASTHRSSQQDVVETEIYLKINGL